MFSALLFTAKEFGRDLTGFCCCFVSGDKHETFLEIWGQGLQKHDACHETRVYIA